MDSGSGSESGDKKSKSQALNSSTLLLMEEILRHLKSLES